MDMNTYENIGKDAKKDITTMEEVFARTLKIGNYTFRLRSMKGKDLFRLVNTFGFSGSKIAVKVGGKEKGVGEIGTEDYKVLDGDTLKMVFEEFGENYDLFMSCLQYSINGRDFVDLVINNICQVPMAETNIAVMYQLMFFVYQAVLLFMPISQQQLKDMN